MRLVPLAVAPWIAASATCRAAGGFIYRVQGGDHP